MNPGIYKNLSIEDYHANRTIVSSTGVKEVKKSTRNFIHYVMYGGKSSKAFDFGNAFEIAVMDAVNGTDEFSQAVAISKTTEWQQKAVDENRELIKPKASKTYKALELDFKTENFGKYMIPDEGEIESNKALKEMVRSCVNNKVVKKLLGQTEYQVSLCWKDSTGLILKSRPDVSKSHKNVLVDIKTTKDATPEAFGRDVASYDYPLQAIMQMDGCVKTGFMKKVDNFFWLAVDKRPPYNFALYEFQKADIEFLGDKYRFYIEKAAKALQLMQGMKDGDLSTLPSYGENADNPYGILTMEIPLWYR